MAQISTDFKPQLIKVSEAAALLRVSTSTIHNWIKADSIPYIKLPAPEGKRAEYRLPLHGLIASLSANYDLADGLDDLVAAAQESGLSGDDVITDSGGAPATPDTE